MATFYKPIYKNSNHKINNFNATMKIYYCYYYYYYYTLQL